MGASLPPRIQSCKTARIAAPVGTPALVLAALAFLWRKLLLATIDEDLAAAEGVPTTWMRIALMLLVAAVVALAMKAVGALLITAFTFGMVAPHVLDHLSWLAWTSVIYASMASGCWYLARR